MPDLRRPQGQRRGAAEHGAERRVALVTSQELPDLDPDSQLLPPALAAAGIDARPTVWTDPSVDWSSFDAVVVRSTWDYFDREPEWLAWIDRVKGEARRLHNPAPVLAWNTHKTYLRDLGERGVPVVDTQWLAAGETAVVEHERGVVKPAVSGGAQGLRQVTRGDEVVAEEDLLVQPLLESIRTEGELSLFYAAGEFTHMVRKVPAGGDIRVQPEFGSDVRAEEPTAEMRSASDAVLAAIEHELLYARVDLVRAADGTLRLIELEVIEPQLYLRWAPEVVERYVAAIASAAG